MANQPVKRKYTIWNTLKERGFFRVWVCPDYKGLWGTEKKLTYKHLLIKKFYIGSTLEFDSMESALNYWTEHFGTK